MTTDTTDENFLQQLDELLRGEEKQMLDFLEREADELLKNQGEGESKQV
jgi:hypothetical protein